MATPGFQNALSRKKQQQQQMYADAWQQQQAAGNQSMLPGLGNQNDPNFNQRAWQQFSGSTGPAPADFRTKGGSANYGLAALRPGEYGAILQGIQGQRGQAGVGGFYEQLLRNFTGGKGDLKDAMEMMAPFAALTLLDTGGAQDLQNYQARAQAPMQQFGGMAGQIGQGATNAVSSGMQQLGRSGLGGSAQRASLAAGAALGAGGQRSDLYSQLFNQAQQQRQAFASQAFDVNRIVASLALGHTPAPRAPEPDNGLLGAGVGMLGGALGSFLGGPAFGAMIGGPK